MDDEQDHLVYYNTNSLTSVLHSSLFLSSFILHFLQTCPSILSSHCFISASLRCGLPLDASAICSLLLPRCPRPYEGVLYSLPSTSFTGSVNLQGPFTHARHELSHPSPLLPLL